MLLGISLGQVDAREPGVIVLKHVFVLCWREGGGGEVARGWWIGFEPTGEESDDRIVN